ncbi:MAG TPA: biosynthetic-type acetolactate synthase large subunit [Peptococcaceae bacterium]|nr:biosynthetic-type acetolactate synthase large subunit [Peptococcaceae bacterium]
MLCGAEILVKCLEQENVEVVFCYPGGANLEILDALAKSSIRLVLVRHEQGAVHEASGYARASGRVGVCLATSGPGATNMVTGIATAVMDSVPVIAITGQVATSMVGTDAFQEVDMTGITDPITKHNYLVKNVDNLARSVKEAFYIAESGRPGPVLLDIPRDVAMAFSDVTSVSKINLRGYKPNLTGHSGQIKQVAHLLSESRRPLIIAGGGILSADCWNELLQLAETQEIPVANTLMGLGSIPLDHPLALGMMGSYGLAAPNYAVQCCDLILALGTRFNERMTCNVDRFAPHAKIIHIDVDPAEIGKNVRVDIPLVGDLKIVLNQLLSKLQPRQHPEWMAEVRDLKASPLPRPKQTCMLTQIEVLEALAKILPDQAIVTTDVGQHQMWSAQRLRHRRPRGFIVSGGLGTMGYGIPAAVGAQLACPKDPVVVITGDGSFQMGMPELGTAKEQKLPLKVLLLNNSYLGMVKQLQDCYIEGRHTAVTFTDNPEFKYLAKAYDALYLKVEEAEELPAALAKFIQHPGMVILEARVAPEENVYPMVLGGRGLDQMEF